MNVLLTEPDKILNQTYKKALVDAKFAVVAVKNVQDAIKEAESTKPDVIIMELQLAEHNGIEFIHEFRSYPEWQNVPIVLNTFTPIESLGMSAGALRSLGIYSCLYKPVTTIKKLIETIKELSPVSQ